MYIPKFKYFFCAPRERALWKGQLVLIKYLNKTGQIPFFISPNKEIYNILKNNDANVEFVLENGHLKKNIFWDVMISESYGIWPFENFFLTLSKKLGKINVNILATISMNNIKTGADTHYKIENTKLIDIMCMPDRRTMDYFYSFNKELDYLITGSPEWDIFNESKNVLKIKEKYGSNLLVLGIQQIKKIGIQEGYIKKVIKIAEKQGFNVLANVHPDEITPDYLKEYIEPIHRYTRFKAASHIICPISSAMTGNCFFLGKKIGYSPMVHIGRKDLDTGLYNLWVEEQTRFKDLMMPLVGEQIFNASTLINDEDVLIRFLSSDKKNYSIDMMDKLFGWPRVPNYCEYFFKIFEEHMEKI